MERRQVNFADVIEPLHRQTDFRGGGGMGVLLTSVGADGRPNVMTIGWGLYGCFYQGHNVAVVAVRPACHTFRLLDEVGEFALCVPTPDMAQVAAFCGNESGRDHDKFAECGFTTMPSRYIRPPCIAECPIQIECSIYYKQRPPHMVLTPEHRQKPVEAQHTIYYAEVLGSFRLD